MNDPLIIRLFKIKYFILFYIRLGDMHLLEYKNYVTMFMISTTKNIKGEFRMSSRYLFLNK